MDIDQDTEEWLGCPNPLEMYKHHCAMLEDEISALYLQLKKARANIAGLVQVNDALFAGKSEAESSLKKAMADISRQHEETSELGSQVRSLEIVASQRDHLFRENQRILLELSVLRGPQP